MTLILRSSMMLAVAVSVAFAATAPSGLAAEPAGPPAVDAAAIAQVVQNFDKVEKQEFPWGWIRWLMNAELDPASNMTLGVVEISAGQQNPAHLHANCEEVLYVLSGSCEHRIGDQMVTLKRGDVLRIPAGVPHAARTLDKPMRAIVVYNTGRRDFTVLDPPGEP